MFEPRYNPVTTNPKSKGTILNLFIKTGNHADTIVCSINTTTTGGDLVSYRYQSKLVTIDLKLKETILNLFIKTGNHMDTILWSINHYHRVQSC